MSYEGWTQFLCSSGHEFTRDVYDACPDECCPFCKSPAVWRNGVDQTNGSYDNNGKRIDGYVKLKIKTPAKQCKCTKCGNSHVSQEATFCIPKSRGYLIPGNKLSGCTTLPAPANYRIETDQKRKNND